MAELERAFTLPAEQYWQPDAWARERRAVFGREWLLFAHEAELAEPGDAVAERLAGWPVFARRGRDGALRAFHDVCMHRAGPLAGPDEGPCHMGRIHCRYHGWTYRDDGRLETTPDFGDALDFDRDAIALRPLRVETWRGFVFVCFDLDARPLHDRLGRLPELSADIALESYRFAHRRSHTLRCNWKTYVENYLEGYHIPWVHPRLHREIDVKSYEVHAAERVVTHHAPARPTVAAPVYDGLWAFLFPNLALNVYGDGLSIERMLPVSATEMRIDYLFLFRADADPRAAEAMCAEVTAEDRRICEAVQRNLEAGIYERGRLSPRHEAGVHDFQQRLTAALGDG